MQKRLDVYELLYKQDLHSLKQFSTNFHSFKEYITIKLILNKIIKCFEKEENQMMIIRCRKKKPWWTKCLRKKVFIMSKRYNSRNTSIKWSNLLLETMDKVFKYGEIFTMIVNKQSYNGCKRWWAETIILWKT